MSELEKVKVAANRVDDLLLQYGDTHSPEEISAMLGGRVSAIRIRARLQEMVRAVDWMTEREQEKFTLLKLRRLLAQLEEKFLDNDNAKLRIALLKTIGDRLDKRRAASETDLNTYSVNVGKEMARVYDLTLAFIRGRLSSQIDPAEWDEVAKLAMEFARDEVMKKAVEA